MFDHPFLERSQKALQLEGHLRDERKIHVLTGDYCPGSDESGVAPHQLYQTNPSGHATRLGVRTIKHAFCFFNSAEKPERARDEADIVVDCLWYTDNGECMTALARFLIESVRAALGSVAAHGEKNVHVARNEIVHRSADIDGTARRAKDRPAMLMNVVNKCRRDLHRLNSALRIEPAVATAETEHFRDAVAVVQFEKERANDVVQARTQTATRNDPGARLLRIEKQLRPRPCQLELDARIRADLDPLGDADFITGRVTFC